jgi:hypothetical protein
MYDRVKVPRKHETYEITYLNGKKEYVNACQTSWSGKGFLSEGKTKIQFHGEPDGDWTLLLSVNEDKLESVRNLSRWKKM